MVVEEIHLLDFTPLVRGFNLDEDLPYQRCNCIDRGWNGQHAGGRQAGIGQQAMGTLTYRPDLRDWTGQSLERVKGKLHDRLVEPANEALVRSEDNRTDYLPMLRSLLLPQVRWSGLTEACSQRKFHGSVVFIQRMHGLWVLSDARSSQCFHRTNNRL